jgi:hypothetical protein
MLWEIDNALMLESLHQLSCAIWRAKNPKCHDHGLRHCPICHRPEGEVSNELRSDYISEGLQ